ncbi:unnamed protein product [Didymodactylos carnosus]|uniref:AB hydrolase-1 domain-containing protein n=1 Tax=Didymodactylos carnosus TaxID=1234261 RepID=A0A813WC08_9BILA|nr:unnamed protein product [Didymodactylos carnosus]CAF1428033.1 unnamed protein product [Didymodactylos carnosus]CAF3643047.1 unnamed protein product [Didymodactylos carnosus]CAF4226793.1 unnamed protein product [Didymodactylos carnosus]
MHSESNKTIVTYLSDHIKTLLLIVPSTVVLLTCCVRTLRRYPNIICMENTQRNLQIIRTCPQLTEYHPTSWIINGHLMTVLGVIFRKLPSLTFKRVLLAVEEGIIAVDWHTQPLPKQPILLLLHGLTGGSHNSYIRYMIKAASKSGLCCVVTHARGCGLSDLTSPRSFSGAWTGDVRETVKYIRKIVGPDTPVFGMGYSLGAGVLTKYIGEEGIRCELNGAIACCPSLNMILSTNKMEKWFNSLLYNRLLTSNLINYLRRHEKHFTNSDIIDLSNVYKSRTIREFDTRVIVPMFRYRDVFHYYEDASSAKYLEHIKIPTLILCAVDDPICDVNGLPMETIHKNDNIIAIKTKEGGHVGWLTGWWPKTYSWENKAIVEYINARLNEMNYVWERKEDPLIVDTF